MGVRRIPSRPLEESNGNSSQVVSHSGIPLFCLLFCLLARLLWTLWAAVELCCEAVEDRQDPIKVPVSYSSDVLDFWNLYFPSVGPLRRLSGQLGLCSENIQALTRSRRQSELKTRKPCSEWDHAMGVLSLSSFRTC